MRGRRVERPENLGSAGRCAGDAWSSYAPPRISTHFRYFHALQVLPRTADLHAPPTRCAHLCDHPAHAACRPRRDTRSQRPCDGEHGKLTRAPQPSIKRGRCPLGPAPSQTRQPGYSATTSRPPLSSRQEANTAPQLASIRFTPARPKPPTHRPHPRHQAAARSAISPLGLRFLHRRHPRSSARSR
jgi:hypothetical protein